MQLVPIERQTNIAELHNATEAVKTELNVKHNLLMCVENLIGKAGGGLDKGLCSDLVTSYVVSKAFGDNQTMIKLARDYLKTQGIQ